MKSPDVDSYSNWKIGLLKASYVGFAFVSLWQGAETIGHTIQGFESKADAVQERQAGEADEVSGLGFASEQEFSSAEDDYNAASSEFGSAILSLILSGASAGVVQFTKWKLEDAQAERDWQTRHPQPDSHPENSVTVFIRRHERYYPIVNPRTQHLELPPDYDPHQP